MGGPTYGVIQALKGKVGDGMTAALLNCLLLLKDMGQFSYVSRKRSYGVANFSLFWTHSHGHIPATDRKHSSKFATSKNAYREKILKPT